MRACLLIRWSDVAENVLNANPAQAHQSKWTTR